MHKSIVLLRLCVVLVFAAALLGCGCGKDANEKYREADADTLFVASDLTLVCTVIDSLDKEYYDTEELRTFVDEEIRTYNYSIPAEAVNFIDLNIEDDVVKLILKYASAEHYSEFNQESLYIGTISEAMELGYDFATTFYKYENLSEAALADALYNVAGYVIIIEPTEEMVINVPGEIKFIGADVTEIDKATAQVKADCRSYIIYE